MSDYHARIMNIRITNYTPEALTPEYREGHRDARHAAAEIALEADARVGQLSKELKEADKYRLNNAEWEKKWQGEDTPCT